MNNALFVVAVDPASFEAAILWQPCLEFPTPSIPSVLQLVWMLLHYRCDDASSESNAQE